MTITHRLMHAGAILVFVFCYGDSSAQGIYCENQYQRIDQDLKQRWDPEAKNKEWPGYWRECHERLSTPGLDQLGAVKTLRAAGLALFGTTETGEVPGDPSSMIQANLMGGSSFNEDYLNNRWVQMKDLEFLSRAFTKALGILIVRNAESVDLREVSDLRNDLQYSGDLARLKRAITVFHGVSMQNLADAGDRLRRIEGADPRRRLINWANNSDLQLPRRLDEIIDKAGRLILTSVYRQAMNHLLDGYPELAVEKIESMDEEVWQMEDRLWTVYYFATYMLHGREEAEQLRRKFGAGFHDRTKYALEDLIDLQID